jgi:hypothetical protein
MTRGSEESSKLSPLGAALASATQTLMGVSVWKRWGGGGGAVGGELALFDVDACPFGSNQSISQLINQSTYQSINQSINQHTRGSWTG